MNAVDVIHERLASALTKFCETIEITGGVRRTRKGHYEPVGDPSWIDLGDAYIEACGALGREPSIDACECEECGRDIPEVDGGDLANRHHSDSCSLYDDSQD